MSRIPLLTPADLDEAQRRVYEAITAGPRGGAGRSTLLDARGALVGPFNSMVTAAAVGAPLQELGAAIRYAVTLSARSREIAILRVAAHRRSGFEWVTHAREGRAAGLTDHDLAAVAAGDVSGFDGPTAERVVLATTCAILEREDLTDAEFDAARAELGVVGLLELITLIGYYSLLAAKLRVLRVAAEGPVPWAVEGEAG